MIKIGSDGVTIFTNKSVKHWHLILKRWDIGYCYQAEKEHDTYQIEWGLISSIRNHALRIAFELEKAYLDFFHKYYIQCQGCGEGFAKYSIKDPNKPSTTRKMLLCCERCVDFYDWHFSKRELVGR